MDSYCSKTINMVQDPHKYIDCSWEKNNRKSSVTEGYNCSCTEHKDAHYMQHTIINQSFK